MKGKNNLIFAKGSFGKRHIEVGLGMVDKIQDIRWMSLHGAKGAFVGLSTVALVFTAACGPSRIYTRSKVIIGGKEGNVCTYHITADVPYYESLTSPEQVEQITRDCGREGAITVDPRDDSLEKEEQEMVCQAFSRVAPNLLTEVPFCKDGKEQEGSKRYAGRREKSSGAISTREIQKPASKESPPKPFSSEKPAPMACEEVHFASPWVDLGPAGSQKTYKEEALWMRRSDYSPRINGLMSGAQHALEEGYTALGQAEANWGLARAYVDLARHASCGEAQDATRRGRNALEMAENYHTKAEANYALGQGLWVQTGEKAPVEETAVPGKAKLADKNATIRQEIEAAFSRDNARENIEAAFSGADTAQQAPAAPSPAEKCPVKLPDLIDEFKALLPEPRSPRTNVALSYLKKGQNIPYVAMYLTKVEPFWALSEGEQRAFEEKRRALVDKMDSYSICYPLAASAIIHIQPPM